MKKLLLTVLVAVVCATPALADFTSEGFYRVHCRGTNRYVGIVGTKCESSLSISTDPDAFWECIKMRGTGTGSYKNKNELHDSVHVTDASTILYIPDIGSSRILYGQATSLYAILSQKVNIAKTGVVVNGRNTYKAYKTATVLFVSVTAYLQDYCGADLGKNNPDSDADSPNTYGQWFLEPVSLDSIDKYYFAPDALTTADASGYYWATLCCDFDCIIPEGSGVIDAYAINANNLINAGGGKYYLDMDNLSSCVTTSGSTRTVGSCGVPVLIKCKYPYPSWNKLVPTGKARTTALDADDYPLSNGLLKGNNFGQFTNPNSNSSWVSNTVYTAEYATAMTSDYLELGLNGGRPCFMASDTAYMPANKAILDVSSLSDKPTAVFLDIHATLDNVESAGVVDDPYMIEDELTCVTVAGDYLVCKRLTDESVTVPAGAQDFVSNHCTHSPITWDRSNWVLLDYADLSDINPSDYVGQRIKAGSVVGLYSDDNNYCIKLAKAPTIDAAASNDALNINTYTLANFNSAYCSASGVKVTNSKTQADSTLFFVAPSVCEYAHIKWAKWNGSAFEVPSTSEGNDYNLTATVPMSDIICGSVNLETGKSYNFDAVVMRASSSASAPQHRAQAASSYVLAPVSIGSGNVTGVIDARTPARQVVSVTYYNLQGHPSSTPHPGLNLTVTRYSDGSMQTSKQLQ